MLVHINTEIWECSYQNNDKVNYLMSKKTIVQKKYLLLPETYVYKLILSLILFLVEYKNKNILLRLELQSKLDL